jgi:hypothetical protein
MSQPDFAVDVYQEEHPPDGAQDVSAIVTVSTAGPPSATPLAGLSRTEIIVIGCAESMTTPGRLAEAQAAAVAALDAIHDGTEFAVLAGSGIAVPVYPSVAGLVVMEAQTRAWDRQAVADVLPGGGTAMGQWLRLAHQLLAAHPAEVRHVLLLADGQEDDPAGLDAAIKLCDGAFTCDCRGIGRDWAVASLRRIAAALGGTVDAVHDQAGLAADFSATMLAAAGERAADVALRIWTPDGASVRFIKQLAPTVENLAGLGAESGPGTTDYPVSEWGTGETRDYFLCVRIEPAAAARPPLAARVSLVTPTAAGRQVLAEAPVRATWAHDPAGR